MKLPARFLEYLRQLSVGSLFATVVMPNEHEMLGKMYFNGSWQNELAKYPGDDFEERERFAELAEMLGGDVDIDPQGRVTLPQKMREKLGLADQSVQIRMSNDTISLYRQDHFDARLDENIAALPKLMGAAAKHRLILR